MATTKNRVATTTTAHSTDVASQEDCGDSIVSTLSPQIPVAPLSYFVFSAAFLHPHFVASPSPLLHPSAFLVEHPSPLTAPLSVASMLPHSFFEGNHRRHRSFCRLADTPPSLSTLGFLMVITRLSCGTPVVPPPP